MPARLITMAFYTRLAAPAQFVSLKTPGVQHTTMPTLANRRTIRNSMLRNIVWWKPSPLPNSV